MADDSPLAFAKVIDRLLKSPRYGERWGRHWLDLARYADTAGFKGDETRPNLWRYRDYVIESMNEDKPYDRFLKEQIAGDELYPDDAAARVATGFNRLWPDESNLANPIQRRQEVMNDITDTLGSVFMGLTYGCARCHDHKFDALSTRDYYALVGYLRSSRYQQAFLDPPERITARAQQLAALKAQVRARVVAELAPVWLEQAAHASRYLLAARKVLAATPARRVPRARPTDRRRASPTLNEAPRGCHAVSPDRSCCRFYLRYDVANGTISPKGRTSGSGTRDPFSSRHEGLAERNVGAGRPPDHSVRRRGGHAVGH